MVRDSSGPRARATRWLNLSVLRSTSADSLRERAAITPHSPVSLLDELLKSRRDQADARAASGTVRHLATRTTHGRLGEVDLPNSSHTV
jgi:hypothetical protein